MIDRTKISDIGIVAAAIIEQQKHGQLCPVIIQTLLQIVDEAKKKGKASSCENGK